MPISWMSELNEDVCHICGGRDWWRRGKEWLCGRCHPNPCFGSPALPPAGGVFSSTSSLDKAQLGESHRPGCAGSEDAQ